MLSKKENKYVIEFDGEKEIVELITELAELLEKGHTTIKMTGEVVGDGDMEDGSNDQEWDVFSLESEY